MANINSKGFVRGTRSIHLSNEGPGIAEKVTATVLLEECVMTTPPETLLQGQGGCFVATRTERHSTESEALYREHGIMLRLERDGGRTEYFRSAELPTDFSP